MTNVDARAILSDMVDRIGPVEVLNQLSEMLQARSRRTAEDFDGRHTSDALWRAAMTIDTAREVLAIKLHRISNPDN